MPRTSPNATPVADILKAFSLNCLIGGTRLCLHMEWRKGNTVSSSDWIEAMEKVWRSSTAQHRIRLNRGDIGFGQEPIMAWHEQGNGKRPSFLFKLKLTANVKKAIANISWDDWQGKSNEGLVQLSSSNSSSTAGVASAG